MFKKSWILIISALFVVNSITVAAVTAQFTDQGKFEAWYKDSVLEMNDRGIILGYPDGQFKPGNLINRAETAVIMDRLYDDLIEQMGEVLISYDQLSEVKFDSDEYSWVDNAEPKNALAMAMAGLRNLDKSPENDCDESGFIWGKFLGTNIPEGYDVYMCSTLVTPGIYVHYTAEEYVPESGGDVMKLDEWYGPFELSTWYSNDVQ